MTQQSVEDDRLREILAEAIYSLDPFYESGEYVDSYLVSPGGNLTWDQAKARDAEFSNVPFMLPVTKFAYDAADAVIAAIDTELLASRSKLKAVEQKSNPVAAGTEGEPVATKPIVSRLLDMHRQFLSDVSKRDHSVIVHSKRDVDEWLDTVLDAAIEIERVAHPTPTPGGVTVPEGMVWQPMTSAPRGVPIVVRQGQWIATVRLQKPEDVSDHWTDGDEVLHYNGNRLVSGFHGSYDGWMSLEAALALSPSVEEGRK